MNTIRRYNYRMHSTQSLSKAKSYINENLKPNQFTETRGIIITQLDKQLTELTADTDTNIVFVWDNLFETDIEQLGSIKLNDQMKHTETIYLCSVGR